MDKNKNYESIQPNYEKGAWLQPEPHFKITNPNFPTTNRAIQTTIGGPQPGIFRLRTDQKILLRNQNSCGQRTTTKLRSSRAYSTLRVPWTHTQTHDQTKHWDNKRKQTWADCQDWPTFQKPNHETIATPRTARKEARWNGCFRGKMRFWTARTIQKNKTNEQSNDHENRRYVKSMRKG